METIRLEAHAKINLSLDVLRRRGDGYHEVRMVMQTLTLCDEIWLEALPGRDEIILEPYRAGTASAAVSDSFSEKRTSEAKRTGQKNGDHAGTCAAGPQIPYDERNLMYRAAKLMRESFGIRDGIRMQLLKRIPAEAGLAGGSADAAAVIRGMNDLFELHAEEEKLRGLGVKIGADVPYCLMGGTALAEGIGEILSPLPPAPPCRVLLVKPRQGVSTKTVYEALRVAERPAEAHPDIDSVLSALQDKNIRKLCGSMGNILELVTEPLVPEIAKIKEAMLGLGAMGALMSGSGPTVFGLFTDGALLQEAAEAFRSGEYRELAKDVIETEFYRIMAL